MGNRFFKGGRPRERKSLKKSVQKTKTGKIPPKIGKNRIFLTGTGVNYIGIDCKPLLKDEICIQNQQNQTYPNLTYLDLFFKKKKHFS